MGNCNVHMERSVKKYPLNFKQNWDFILEDIRLMWRARSHSGFDILLKTFNQKWIAKGESDFVETFNKSYGGPENRFWYIGALIPGKLPFISRLFDFVLYL